MTAYLDLEKPQIGLYIPKGIYKEKNKNCECLASKRNSATIG